MSRQVTKNKRREKKERHTLVFTDEGKTHPNERNDTLRSLYRQHLAARLPFPVQVNQPFYGDFSNGFEYTTMLDRITQARDAFQSLPSEVRRYVDNDPAAFIEALADEDEREELQERGLKLIDENGEPIPYVPQAQRAAIAAMMKNKEKQNQRDQVGRADDNQGERSDGEEEADGTT